MSNTPAPPEVEDLIRYDILAQEALRGVVKKVLQEVSKTGLPGEHHFYITFDTQFSGVRMSTRMLEKYPEEMTIVVQHQYWDLEATDHAFSIGLSFDNIPETMHIPFAAVRGFFDPSVQFGLQFEATETDFSPPDEKKNTVDIGEDAEVSALPSPPKVKKITDANSDDEAEPTADDSSADVVSLDAFRKK